MNGAAKNPPAVTHSIDSAPRHGVMMLKNGAIGHLETTCKGTLTAKKVGSDNPMAVSPSGVSYSGENGSASVDKDGSVSAELSSTLKGLRTLPSINGWKGTMEFGVVGKYSTQAVKVSANKFSYTFETQEFKKVVNGVEISGKLSCVVELTVIPDSRKKSPVQTAWSQFTSAVSSTLEAFGQYLLIIKRRSWSEQPS